VSTAALRRVTTRRRGELLLAAIHAATLAELGEHGFHGLSIERVAERAHTGKASIYRRWPNRLELVLDALDGALPQPADAPDTGSVRGDLLEVLRRIATSMGSPEGAAAKTCFEGADDELTRAVRERLLPPRRAMMTQILRRGVARGEVRPDAVTERVAEVGPMLLHGELLQRGAPIPDEAVVAMVDEVLLPLLRP
jgi:AcrR family transcriptional regulator